jgi:hypothetical protein
MRKKNKIYIFFIYCENCATLFEIRNPVLIDKIGDTWGGSEWVIIVWCQLGNISDISWVEQVNFQWDDDEVHFLLDQHT